MMVCNRGLAAVLIVLGLTTGLMTACGEESASVASPPASAVGQQPDGEEGPTISATTVVSVPVAPTTTVPTVEGPEAVATFVAPEPSAEPKPTATPATELYSIQPGDTLLGLALTRGIELAELQALNPDVRAEALQIGQQIIVPAFSSALPRGFPTTAGSELVVDWAVVADEPGVWVIGQVRNDGTETLAPAQLIIVLQAVDGTEAARSTTWTAGRRIEAGSLAPFALYVPTVSALDATAQVSVESPGPAPVSETAMRADNITVQRDVAAAEVRGLVINEGESTVGDLLLTATFYDADGRYGGYRQLELPGELAPGEERPFSMAALPVRGTVDAVSVQVDARPPGE